jgi:alpha-tubulin suppressor-like RCC1 family protein
MRAARRSSLVLTCAVAGCMFASACFWDFDASLLSEAGDEGCVDDLGARQPGTEATACGHGGGRCMVCSGALDTCLDGACVPENAPTSIDAGGPTSCAVDRQGTVWCWGGSRFFTLGFEGDSAGPVRIDLGEAADQVAAGGGYATTVCARTRTTRLLCWGNNGEGQIGIGTTGGPIYPPVEVSGGGAGWSDVAVGHYHAVGVRDGRLYGWGDNQYGEGGLPPGTPALTPTPVDDDVTTWWRVSTHDNGGCGIRDVVDGAGDLYCWGDNGEGQLGIGTSGTPLPDGPVPTASPTGYVDASVGPSHACGVRTGGRLFCWGLGDAGRLGTGDAASRAEPTEVAASLAPFSMVTCGDAHTCALTAAGAVYCFGSNEYGQIGLLDDGAVALEATRVLPDEEVVDLDAGSAHTCAITRERRILCWGSNGELESGDPDPVYFHPQPYEIVLM